MSADSQRSDWDAGGYYTIERRNLHEGEQGAQIYAFHGGNRVDVRRLRLYEHSPLVNATTWQLAIKRALDVVGASILLILFAPLMLLAALAVRLTSQGPVFFRQERVAQNGARFQMLKFRSMYCDAEDRLSGVLALNQHTGPVFKARNDPRITWVGRLLRRWSIDELPQLVHVLNGTMSLVGPRPALPQEAAHYSPRAWQRLLAKPGLTCIWQVRGRSNLDFDTWVHMDLTYVARWSLRLDLRLLAATVPAVISGEGAY